VHERPPVQAKRACGVENVHRGDTCKSASPGNDGPDHAAGAAGNEPVTGLDHSKLIKSDSN